MATGQRPYTSSQHGKLMDEILHRPAPPPSTANRKLPSKLDEIILLAVISPQGGAIDELMPGDTTEGDPNWSPDGTRIVFSTALPGTDSRSDIRMIDIGLTSE